MGTRSSRRLGLLALTAVAATTLSGCGLATEFLTNEKTVRFDDRAAADADDDLAFRLPDLVPADATDITVRIDTTDPNLKAYDWLSASGQLPAECQPAPPPADGAVNPFFTSGWPDGVTTTAGFDCGIRRVAEVDGRFHAWYSG